MKLFRRLFVVSIALLAVSCTNGLFPSGSGEGGQTQGTVIHPESVEVSEKSIRLEVDQTKTLTATVLPANATNKKIKWVITQGTSYIELNETTGLVKALEPGLALVEARIVGEGTKIADECSITVTPKPVHASSISLSKDTLEIKQGNTAKLTATVLPSDATDKQVTWSSSNESDATVDNGLISALLPGETTITATTVDGGHTASCLVKVNENVDVTGVSLNYESYKLEKGDTVQLVATVYPLNAGNKEVKWSVSRGSTYVGVDANGLVTAKKVGTGTIRVTTSESGFSKTCSITVVEKIIPVTGVELESIATVKEGATTTLIATILPSDASNKAVTWTSSNEAAATVDSKGVVTGVKEGLKTSITVTTADGNKSASCEVTVLEPTHVSGVSLDQSSATVKEGKKLNLVATVSPSDAANKKVNWNSSNNDVATVSDGIVTAIKQGTAVITATSVDGGYTAKCTVTVEEKGANAWTIMLYICGSNLESDSSARLATADIKEILSVSGQPDDINIIMETGGAKSWAATYGISANYLERWHVENKQLVKDDSLTYASMGLSSTLQSFLTWGLTEYPADNVGLILWNHGGGMDGVCYDEKKNDDCLTDNEVVTAVKGAFTATHRDTSDKLTFIGYDACLMQVQDIAEMNSPYFEYMVASQESEGGEGWDYDTWVDDLYAGKDNDTIFKAICNGFISSQGSNSDQTLSYLDLAYANEYMTAWENMAGVLKTKVTSSNSSSFNSIFDNVKDYEGSTYGLYDAKDFVNRLSSNSTFNPGSEYTTAVLNAHAKLVRYNKTGTRAGNSFGVSLYWKGSYISTYTAGTPTHFTNWAYLSSTYGSTSSGGGWWW